MTRKAAIRLAVVFFSAAVLIGAAGCGTVQHNLILQNDYAPKDGTKIEVGTVSNDTGRTFDIRIEDMLRDALIKTFQEEGLTGTGDAARLQTNCRILTYEKGDAFKRWLLPGWGSTVLTIQCDLLDANKNVGTIDAKRTVDAGGAYTAGAWEKIFAHVASDVAEDIKAKLIVKKE